VVGDQIVLIQEIQTAEWWQDVTLAMLESARKKLRGLVKLIEKKDRKIVYSDFEDMITGEQEIDFGPILPRSSANFQAKARQFLRAHLDHIAVQKVRMNRQLTPTDIEELERMLIENAVGTPEDIDAAREESGGKLGLFIRSLVGLDRAAGKEAFSRFLTSHDYSSNQIEFVNLIVDHLTEQGVIDPTLLWSSPYTDLSAKGADGVFSPEDVDRLVEILNDVKGNAAA
jgi:type I restriction enzyme, R subunit